MTIDAMVDEARKLAPSDRLRLIGEVWGTLEAKDADVPLTDEQAAEIDRRLERLERDGSKGVPWEDFKRELFARVGP